MISARVTLSQLSRMLFQIINGFIQQVLKIKLAVLLTEILPLLSLLLNLKPDYLG